MFQRRREQLKFHVEKMGMHAVLIDSPSNLYYYTGFTGGEGMFFLPVGESKGYIITDSRYYEQVEKECPDITLVRMENKGFSELVKDILDAYYAELGSGVGNTKLEATVVNPTVSSLNTSNSYRLWIALEDSMNLRQYLKLCETCAEDKFSLAQAAIMESRMVKDEEELRNIARAEAIGDAAFTHILGLIKPGVSEWDIALELEFFMKRQGASKLSFDTIVASGANSSMPHAQVTNRKLRAGDFITMDFGCVYQGYCSDMTRTVALGTPTEEMQTVYQIVLDANLSAMEGIREGVVCNQVDALARDYISSKGYGIYFGHGLGHGVGLDIHEEPRFSKKCDVITKENMVITNEPGIYLPGKFGVRIEDLVVVKKNGCEILSHSDKNLIVL